MPYKITTFLENKPIKSEKIQIKEKSVYGILNKYIRANEKIMENEGKSAS